VKNLQNNLFFLLLGCFFILALGFSEKASYSSLETKELTIVSPDGKGRIYLGFDKKNPTLLLQDEKGKTQIQLTGGEQPLIVMQNKEQKPVLQMQLLDNDSVNISLCNSKGEQRLALQGDNPGLFLFNDTNRRVGSMTVLGDGGAGLGFAEKTGEASTILRGGDAPGVAFFAANDEPSAALGIMQKVPHLLISGNLKNEGILIHGGKASGLMVVDEEGKLKIFISKHGVFQQKEEEQPVVPEGKKEKLFTLDDDFQKLFPDTERKSIK
jgi:hypothetical protein